MDDDKEIFRWHTTEPKELFIRRMRGARLGYIVLVGLSYTWYLRHGVLGIFLGVLLVAFLEIAGLIIGKKYPRKVEYFISQEGVFCGIRSIKHFVLFSTLRYFSTFDQKLKTKNFSTIIMIKGKGFAGDVGLTFDNNEDYQRVREELSKLLPEKSTSANP